MPNTIPPNWQEKTLGEVCEIISGTTPDTKNSKYWDGSNYWITPAELSEEKIFITDCRRKITDLAIQHCSLRPMPKGTIIFSSRAPIGKVAISDVDTLYCNQGFKNFICSKSIYNKFLYYFLKLNTPLLISLGNGTTFKEISKSTISKVHIGFPSLPEQKRIVEKLDKIFANIDKAKEQTTQNLKNAKEIFEVQIDATLKPHSDWRNVKMADICDVRDGTHDSPKYIKSGFPLVTSKNLKNGTLVFDNIKYISQQDYDHINERSKVDVGDVLFAMIGTIGNPVVVTEEPKYAIKNMALFKHSDEILPSFLKYILGSRIVLDKMQKEANGTTQKFVSLGYLRNFKISLPSNKQQLDIVKTLDSLRAQTQELETIYTKKLADLDELKQSVLQQAFSGKL